MKVAYTSDLHMDLERMMDPGELERVRDTVRESKPDVFIIAGDIVGLGRKKLLSGLRALAVPGALNLIVPGNHDLWLADGSSSLRHYFDELPRLYAEGGFHMLDTAPKLVEDVGFVGSVGWYDYSFMHPDLPPSPKRRYDLKRWHPVTSWNDGVHVRLGMSDPEFNELLLLRFRDHLREVLTQGARRIVAVTHHLAFREQLTVKDDDAAWNFNNAFMGAASWGQTLLDTDCDSIVHLCGHTHAGGRFEKGQVMSITIGSTYQTKEVGVFEL